MDSDELLKISDRCITDEPSACMAYCPIHIDLRSFMKDIEKEDFKKAYKTMSRKMPFARIIGKICDHPCENVCVRKDIGGSINIGELEKITVELGFTAKRKGFPVPKNDKNVAVVGCGISGMTVADSLDRKGYNITVYERGEKIGGRIWDYQGRTLSSEAIENELKEFGDRNIHIRLKENIDVDTFNKMTEEYDAVYLGTGKWMRALNYDSKTLQAGNSNVFIGGSIFHKSKSVIYSVSSAITAAISMDRYLQNASMTAAREIEGSYETSLVINTGNIKTENSTIKNGDLYTAEEASREAGRCLKCQCLNCAKVCSHLKKYDRIPKKYIREINHNETIVLGNHYANKIINSCAMCGLCKEVCPSCIDMKEIIGNTRKSMVQRGKMPISAHDFALKDMIFSNGKHFSLVRMQPGHSKVKYVFYPGCQLSASEPGYIEKSYDYLMKNLKEGVGIFLGCCGAPADWAGRMDLMKENIDFIKNKWESMGKPVFILACSSCCGIFEKYMPEIKYISLWEIMDSYGVPMDNSITEKHVLNIHDACTTRYNTKIQNSIRHIASKLGYTIEELQYSKEKTKCCGYGGLIYFANREQSDEFVEDRIGESKDDYLVYCAMCKDLFVSKNKRTYHILDLIYGHNMENVPVRKVPTLSERHSNRGLLKMNLMRHVWNEEVNDLKKNIKLKLIITDRVKKEMDDRMILLEDVEKVIENAEKTKERFLNPKNSHYLGRLRIDNVTHWVEYEKKGEEFLIYSVYTHRMEIVEE